MGNKLDKVTPRSYTENLIQVYIKYIKLKITFYTSLFYEKWRNYIVSAFSEFP